MVNDYMIKLGLSWDFIPGDGRMYGFMEGYMVTMLEDKESFLLFVNAYLGGEKGSEVQKELEQYLVENEKKHDFMDWEVSSLGCFVEFPGDESGILKLGRCINDIVEWFEEHEIPKGVCTLTGREIPEYTGYRIQLGEFVYLFDEETGKKVLNKEITIDATNPAREDEEKRSLLPGIIGGVVGGALMVLFWIFMYCIAKITNYIGIVVGLFTKLGYERGKGPKGNKKLLAVMFVSMILTTVSVCLGVTLSLTLEAGRTLSLGNIIVVLKEVIFSIPKCNSTALYFLKELLFGMIFTLGSLYVLFRKERKESKKINYEPVKVP